MMSELAETVAANIRAEAARRRQTQTSLGRALGMSQVAVSDRYRGRTPWTLNEVEAVARLLQVPAAELLVRPKGFEPPTFWFGACTPLTDPAERWGLAA